MKPLLTFLLLFLFQVNFAQTIDYNLPKGYEIISKKNYKKLVDESVKFLKNHYTVTKVDDGGVYVEIDGQESTFNLHNLLYVCAEISTNEYDDLVEEHFGGIIESIKLQESIDLDDYSTVKDYLSLRVYQEEFVDEYGADFIHRVDLEGTGTVLMLDLPSTFVPISKENFKNWSITKEEAFTTAQKNVNLQEIEKVTETFEIEPEITVEISFIGNEDYAASYALDLQNNSPELVGEWGSVVAIPNKGIVDICKVSKEHPIDYVNFIQITYAMVYESFIQHPQPISPDFYWYYEGKFKKILVTQDEDGAVNVVSPMRLTNIMIEDGEYLIDEGEEEK